MHDATSVHISGVKPVLTASEVVHLVAMWPASRRRRRRIPFPVLGAGLRGVLGSGHRHQMLRGPRRLRQRVSGVRAVEEHQDNVLW